MTDGGPGRTGRVTHPRIRPRRGAARASTWWGKAWVRAAEESAYGDGDLKAARSLARAGSVGAITVTTGRYLAAVEDGDELWSTGTTLPVLDEPERAAFVEAVAAESGRLPALLAGELPHALVEHAEEAGVELVPYGEELAVTCTCGHWHAVCGHSLAVLHQLCWIVDRDASTLLHLRGAERDELLASLRRGLRPDRRAGQAAVDVAAPGESTRDQVDDVEIALDAVLRARHLLEE